MTESLRQKALQLAEEAQGNGPASRGSQYGLTKATVAVVYAVLELATVIRDKEK